MNRIVICLLIAIGPLAVSQTVPRLTLDEARKQLKQVPAPKSLGAISLAGFEYSRELDVGEGMKVIVVSGNNGGGLLAFGTSGSLLSAIETGQVESIQLFDLDSDGVSEIITDEVTGRGTGIFEKEFNVYSLSGTRFRRLWHDKSYSSEDIAPASASGGKPEIRIERSFLRFDEGRGSIPTCMTYVQLSSNGRMLSRKSFALMGESLKEIPASQ